MFKKSIRIKIIASTLMVLMLSLVATYFTIYLRSYNILKDQILKNNSVLLSKLSQHTNYIINDTKQLAIDIILDEEIQNLLREDHKKGAFGSAKNSSRLKSKLSSFIPTRNTVCNICIVKRNGDVASAFMESAVIEGALKDNWFKEFLIHKEGNVNYFSEKIEITNANEGTSLSLINYVRTIYDKDEPGKELGTVIVGIYYNAIAEVFKKLDTEFTKYTLVDTYGYSYYGSPDYTGDLQWNTQSASGGNKSQKLEDKKNFILLESSLDNHWKLVGYISKTEIREKVATAYLFIIIIGIFSILLTAVILALLLFKMTGPITKLWRAMKSVSEGNLDVAVNVETQDEIGQLSKIFNLMTCNIRELIQKISIEENEKRNFHIKALLMQINPHFIYNTLNSVIYLARKNQSKEIIELIVSLIHMMQKTIRWENEFVEIGNELDYIKDYKRIQTIRYGDIFDITFDINSELMEYKIPRMLIQPLVENALFHGILEKKVDGIINIEIKEENKVLNITITDNGIGINQERVESLLSSDNHQSDDRFISIGLKNVNDRIKLFYGNNYGLIINSIPGKGTTIRFSIPIS